MASAKDKIQPLADRVVVKRIIEKADTASANAALINDKRFLFNEAQTAFIMYQISGRTWVALGDPVGPESDRDALTWQFLELCDRFDGWTAFYQVSEKSLSVYIDMGLTLSKLGEEALIPLAEFSLEIFRGWEDGFAVQFHVHGDLITGRVFRG